MNIKKIIFKQYFVVKNKLLSIHKYPEIIFGINVVGLPIIRTLVKMHYFSAVMIHCINSILDS